MDEKDFEEIIIFYFMEFTMDKDKKKNWTIWVCHTLKKPKQIGTYNNLLNWKTYYQLLWCCNSLANHRGEYIKKFCYFRFHNAPANFIICLNGEICFCSHLREKIILRNSPQNLGQIYSLPVVWTTLQLAQVSLTTPT